VISRPYPGLHQKRRWGGNSEVGEAPEASDEASILREYRVMNTCHFLDKLALSGFFRQH